MSDPLWKKVEDAAKEGAVRVSDAVDTTKDAIVKNAIRVEQGADSLLDKIKKSNWTWAILLGVFVVLVFFAFN